MHACPVPMMLMQHHARVRAAPRALRARRASRAQRSPAAGRERGRLICAVHFAIKFANCHEQQGATSEGDLPARCVSRGQQISSGACVSRRPPPPRPCFLRWWSRPPSLLPETLPANRRVCFPSPCHAGDRALAQLARVMPDVPRKNLERLRARLDAHTRGHEQVSPCRLL